MTDSPSAIWRWTARLAVLTPILVAVVRAIANDWFPVGDSALLAIRAYDVGTSHHPLLGSWTSASLALGIDVNNPGPLYYDLAAPFMWTFGRLFGIGTATAIAIGTINASAALGTALVGSRVGGWRTERWMLLLVTALMWSMGSELLIDIWQPHALLLPFCLLVALTIAVAAGDTWMLPVWIGVASLVVQTHVAYVYAVAALAVIAAVALWRRGERRAFVTSKPFLWSGVVLVVAWIQPIWEQLFGEGEGNLQRLATNASGGDLTVGGGTAVKIVAAVTALPPWWARSGFETTVPSRSPLVSTASGDRLDVAGLPGPALSVLALCALIAVLVTLIVVLRRESQRIARIAAVVSLSLLLVSIVGLSAQAVTVTGLGSHQVRWLFALAVVIHVTVLWGVVELASARWPGSPWLQRRFDIGLGVVLAALTLANLPYYAHDLGPTADRAAADTLRGTFDDLDDFDFDGPVVYDLDNLIVFEPYSTAIMMRLRELGVEFRYADGPMLRQMGNSRRADGSEQLHLRQYERGEALLYDGDGCVVSIRSGLSPEDEAAADELIAAAVDDLASGTIEPDVAGLPDEVARLVQSAAAGNRDDALLVIGLGLLPELVADGRVPTTPALEAAVASSELISDRIDSTLLVVATPSDACPD